MKQSISRSWKNLAKERLENQKPTIPLGSRFWPLSPQEREGIQQLIETPSLHRLATSLRSRDNDAAVEVVDAALGRIEKLNPGLNAFVTLCAEPARQDERTEEMMAAVGRLLRRG